MLSDCAHQIVIFVVEFSRKVGASPLIWNKKFDCVTVAKRNSFMYKKFQIAVFLMRLYVACLWFKLINCHYNDQCKDDFGTKFIHFFMASSLILPLIFEIKMVRQDDITALFINQMFRLDRKLTRKAYKFIHNVW